MFVTRKNKNYLTRFARKDDGEIYEKDSKYCVKMAKNEFLPAVPYPEIMISNKVLILSDQCGNQMKETFIFRDRNYFSKVQKSRTKKKANFQRSKEENKPKKENEKIEKKETLKVVKHESSRMQPETLREINVSSTEVKNDATLKTNLHSGIVVQVGENIFEDEDDVNIYDDIEDVSRKKSESKKWKSEKIEL